MMTSPEVGFSSRPAICSSVVLPEPLGPSNATISPRRTWRSTPRRISNRWPPCSKLRRTSLSSRTTLFWALFWGLLTAKRLHGVELRRLPSRVKRGGERKHERHARDQRHLARLHLGRQLREEVYLGRKQ